MKRFFIMSIAVLGLFILAACGVMGDKVDGNVYEKIHRQLMGMESFTAQATVTYITNNTTITYETLQHARKTGEYRIQVTYPSNVAGNTTVFDGAVISQFNPHVHDHIAQTTIESPERLEILLTSFVRNYSICQEASVTATTIDESLTTVLEAAIPGEHPYLSFARLWVSNDSLLPQKMTIYDVQGVERVIVVYNSFEFNSRLEDSIFRP